MFCACNELKKDLREMILKGNVDGRGLGLHYKKCNHFIIMGFAYCWGDVNVVLCVLWSYDTEAQEQEKMHLW